MTWLHGGWAVKVGEAVGLGWQRRHERCTGSVQTASARKLGLDLFASAFFLLFFLVLEPVLFLVGFLKLAGCGGGGKHGGCLVFVKCEKLTVA
ncbi:hypothetical protein M0R45_008766 [Rubus argutus]|uniref:Uncharacterized protein n=1 Tax=Rubus argutus TaxID=59490 RepID=A0AAW1Y258_RUBAR